MLESTLDSSLRSPTFGMTGVVEVRLECFVRVATTTRNESCAGSFVVTGLMEGMDSRLRGNDGVGLALEVRGGLVRVILIRMT